MSAQYRNKVLNRVRSHKNDYYFCTTCFYEEVFYCIQTNERIASANEMAEPGYAGGAETRRLPRSGRRRAGRACSSGRTSQGIGRLIEIKEPGIVYIFIDARGGAEGRGAGAEHAVSAIAARV
ncbi:hypothetical protein EVAR_9084_1 [Eumeta japonica]|uniref:Uncharacterized protein n=1 Tax=Eumeta variegata TaxID=151549 RepID=A0A4C1TW24_EUMVA|nr:hypothetical protein EVAR_9084_1 [Eumeta japonica]